jgi:hypothetical protein
MRIHLPLSGTALAQSQGHEDAHNKQGDERDEDRSSHEIHRFNHRRSAMYPIMVAWTAIVLVAGYAFLRRVW